MSTEALLPRTRVLRGAAAAAIRGVSMDADLSLLRPFNAGVVTTVEEAEEAARAVRQEASRVGYEDGYAAGLAAAADQTRALQNETTQRATAALSALDAAAASLTGRQQVTVADVEQRIAEVAIELAEAILRRELAACDAPARDAMVRALQLAPPRVNAVARLHPDDVATIGDLMEIAPDREVAVIADAAVEQGGCVLEVGPCRIDAQITPALQRVREVLEA